MIPWLAFRGRDPRNKVDSPLGCSKSDEDKAWDAHQAEVRKAVKEGLPPPDLKNPKFELPAFAASTREVKGGSPRDSWPGPVSWTYSVNQSGWEFEPSFVSWTKSKSSLSKGFTQICQGPSAVGARAKRIIVPSGE